MKELYEPRHSPPTDGSDIRPWNGSQRWTPVGDLWARAGVHNDRAVSFHTLAAEHGPMVKVSR